MQAINPSKQGSVLVITLMEGVVGEFSQVASKFSLVTMDMLLLHITGLVELVWQLLFLMTGLLLALLFIVNILMEPKGIHHPRRMTREIVLRNLTISIVLLLLKKKMEIQINPAQMILQLGKITDIFSIQNDRLRGSENYYLKMKQVTPPSLVTELVFLAVVVTNLSHKLIG